MSLLNVAALKQMFTPPAPVAGVPTTQQMQQTAAFARLSAKLAQFYAGMELPQVQAAQAQVDSEININPTTASEALRAEQEALQAEAQTLQNVFNQSTNYSNGADAWYENMTGGSAYVPIDQWRETQPASYPDLFATLAKVTI